MANVQSSLVSNDSASPVVFNHVGLYGARLRAIVATVEHLGVDANTYMLARVHPEWRILQIWTMCDTSSGATDFNVGLYSDAAGTKVDDNCYADAQTLATAITKLPVDLANHTRDIANFGQQVYLDAGHTTANKLDAYWIGFEGVDAGSSGSYTLSVNIQFTSD